MRQMLLDHHPGYVLCLDLDGVVADFYPHIQILAAEWRGVPPEDLSKEVTWGVPEWGFTQEEYLRFHRFAVTERDLFLSIPVISGAPQGIRRLAAAGIRIRLATHRFYLDHLFRISAEQTVEWLDKHAIPYHDLCFIQDKCAVQADMFVDDSPLNITSLETAGHRVIAYTNSTNINLPVGLRADSWPMVEEMVMRDYSAQLIYSSTAEDSPFASQPGSEAGRITATL